MIKKKQSFLIHILSYICWGFFWNLLCCGSLSGLYRCMSRWRYPSRLLLYPGTAVKMINNFTAILCWGPPGEAVCTPPVRILVFNRIWSNIWSLIRDFLEWWQKIRQFWEVKSLKKTYLYSYTRYNLIQGPAVKKKFRSAVYLLHLIYTVLQLDGYPGFDAAEAAHMLYT